MGVGAVDRLYLITDGRSVHGGADLADKVVEALKGGVRLVQLREKDLNGKDLLRLALRLRSVTNDFGAKLLINDRMDVALLSGSDGVHLGQSSVPASEARKMLGGGKLIGVSAHSLKEARKAEEDGADLITFGPVYPTESKASYGSPVGLVALKEVSSALDLPVYAIGGVKKETVREVMVAGAFGAAVISAILGSANAAKSAEELVEEIKRHGVQRA